MSVRACFVIAFAMAAVSCGSNDRRGPEPQRAALGGELVARVGDAPLSADVVTRVASARGIPPREALSMLIEDALLAKGAVTKGIDRAPATAHSLRAARARLTLAHIRDAAIAAGPPNDEEVGALSARHWLEVDLPEQMVVIHAVVMRPKKAELEPRAKAFAAGVATRLAPATSADDFEARAKALHEEGLELKVERLEPFVADGRIALPGASGAYDKGFASAAASLPAPGATSGVVESPFGWHVIRLLERRPGKLAPFEERRAAFAEEARAMRGRDALEALLAELHARTRVDVVNGVDAVMREAATAAALGGDGARANSSTPAR